MSEGNNSIKKTLIVAVSLSIVCSVIVSGAATLLKPVQEANKLLDRQKNVLAAAGLLKPGTDIKAEFKRIDRKIVDLDTGEFTDAVDPETYDQRKAQKNPELSKSLPRSEDPASINRREKYSLVYIVRTEGGDVDKVILPIRGYGLWSTLYGYLAIEADGNTVAGLTYYEHGETPGLGGEVDNPNWKSQWPGKKLYDENGDPAIDVLKGKVDPQEPDAEHKIDGLAGSTLTSNGIENMFQFWLGERGFGPFLDRLRQGNLS